MARLIVYYAHPGHKYSKANRAMVAQAREVRGISFVDLYAEYPRFDIDIDREQVRLLEHDVILFQFPMFWYSTPSLIKEWEDLVLEPGFAYGAGGDKLTGKRLMLAVTAVNGCRYCSYYHAQEALKAGLPDEELQMLLEGVVDDAPPEELPALLYAQHWAEAEGQGLAERVAYVCSCHVRSICIRRSEGPGEMGRPGYERKVENQRPAHGDLGARAGGL